MPRTQGDEEQEHEEGNPHEAKDEKGATTGGLSEKDMTELYATLDKMKIKPDNFISWLTKQTEEEKKPKIPIPPKTPVDSDDDSIYLTGELYPVQNEDTSEDRSIPTLTGDDQESAECLEEGSREDAPNQNTEASDDPDTSSSSSSSNSSISRVLADTQDEIHEDDDTDEDDQNIPRRSTRVRQKPKWMENFVCSQLAYQPSNWKEKVLCFKEMTSELKEMDKEMSKEFLKMFIKKF
uniref:Uncharacterized protein n=1 Tax=Magallana gigas TaxID=29159 RepID=A0A8W8HU04_MAGGI